MRSIIFIRQLTCLNSQINTTALTVDFITTCHYQIRPRPSEKNISFFMLEPVLQFPETILTATVLTRLYVAYGRNLLVELSSRNSMLHEYPVSSSYHRRAYILVVQSLKAKIISKADTFSNSIWCRCGIAYHIDK